VGTVVVAMVASFNAEPHASQQDRRARTGIAGARKTNG